MRLERAILLVGLLLLGACSTGRPGAPRTDRNAISLEEIRGSHYEDAYTLVQALRPNWLIPRGQASIHQREEIKVYLDGMLAGGVEYLKQIATRSVSMIRYYDGLEATQRWGLDHGQGAIAVTTLQ